MKLFSAKPEDLRNPENSDPALLRIENASDCDGTICGTAITDSETGETVSRRGAHSHLVASGYNPLASPLYTPISK